MAGLLSALGGGAGKVALVQLGAGALSGIVAMTALIAAGVVPVRGGSGPGQKQLALVGCPGTGSIVAVAQPGEKMLVTAKSADGGWLRVYIPGPAEHEGWVPLGSVDLLADASALPVKGCSEVAAATGTPGATATPTPAPTASPTETPNVSSTATPRVTPPPAATPVATGSQATTAPTSTPVPTPTANVGPAFTSGPSADNGTLATNPLGTGNCGSISKATLITVGVDDPDGVASIALWVKKPGASSFAVLHPFYQDPDWQTSIDTGADGIDVAGTLSWYAVAKDTKGAETKSKTQAIKVVRCDTEATISGGILLDQPYDVGVCDSIDIPFNFKVSDPDGLASAPTLTYTVRNQSGTSFSDSIALTLNFINHSWFGDAVNNNGPAYFGDNTVSWTVTTHDNYGGASTKHQVDGVTGTCIV